MWIERDPRAFDSLGEEIVERGEDVAGLGVVAVLELVVFFLMASGAIAASRTSLSSYYKLNRLYR